MSGSLFYLCNILYRHTRYEDAKILKNNTCLFFAKLTVLQPIPSQIIKEISTTTHCCLPPTYYYRCSANIGHLEYFTADTF